MKTYAEAQREQRLKDLATSMDTPPVRQSPWRKSEEELRQIGTTEIEISPTLAESNREYMQKFEGEE